LGTTCHITQLAVFKLFDSNRTSSIMIGYQRSRHSTHSIFIPGITTAASAVAMLLHVVMPSILFVSCVKDMLVLIKFKFSGSLVTM